MDLHNKKAYPIICLKILEELSEKLPEYLTYHCIDHMIDVANVCDHYINYYKIRKPEADLLRIAAVSHDYGYLYSPKDHEKRGIIELASWLEKDYSKKEVDFIAGLIMATKIPQNPQNFYEKIMDDADLDYLGRDDYNKWSDRLYQEFLHYGVVHDNVEWLEVQIKFLENHHYHTDLAKEKRADIKNRKLQELVTLKKLSDSSA